MNQKPENTFTTYDPTAILARLVSLKDIRVLAYHRHSAQQEIEIEQVLKTPTCLRCNMPARVKERPKVALRIFALGMNPHFIWM